MDVLSFYSLLSLFFCVTMSENIIKLKMEEFQVIPDVIDKSPVEILKITYNEDDEVNFGNILTPTQVKNAPNVTWNAELDSFYTLLMVDPDAPTRKMPAFREVRHWFIGNIKGCNLETGDEITEYLGSGPPKNTGFHRYIFLVYKQPGKIEFDEPKTESLSRCHRFRFNAKKFVKKYNLGEPIAGNFYQAEWDSYVDVRGKDIKNCDVL